MRYRATVEQTRRAGQTEPHNADTPTCWLCHGRDDDLPAGHSTTEHLARDRREPVT